VTITATVIADSISPQGIRLITMQCRYPKYIHGETMTHRVFSRNASSSRAIPVSRLIQDIIDDPVMPTSWGSNKRGMQAGDELPESAKRQAIACWLSARDQAVHWAQTMDNLGVAKQIVNRILEPWCHINTLITSTEWANFYALRCHKDAQPEMHALADAIFEAQLRHVPKLLHPGEWHVPYAEDEYRTRSDISRDGIIKLSVARCARVSYLTHEGKPPNVEDDLKLYERLVGSVPLHASPAEHQATPDDMAVQGSVKAAYVDWRHPEQHANFVGWRQFRRMLPNESVHDR
jgi:thymidylate synthase ThyX